MIVTDRLLFLHLHKSGGTFVNALLLRCIPSAQPVGYHLPYREVPDEYRDRPVLGTVRNPWAYYVSWYHFQLSQQTPNILFRVCSDNGDLGLKATIANLIDLSSDNKRLKLLEGSFPESYAKRGLNLTKGCIRELRASGLGFYSFLYQRLYAGAHAPMILRAEELRDGLRSALSATGHLPNACAEEFLIESPPLNTSAHDEPGAYFDQSLFQLVADRDRTVIERYGYTRP